jgi:putative tricarboxylic transport membrane protein
MIRGDVAAGAIVLALGATILATASTFPAMPGQNVGPALFPMLIGSGLAISGLILVVGPGLGRVPDVVAFDEGLRRPRMALNAALVVAGLAAYALLVGTLGFFITSTALLLTLFVAFGARPVHAVPIAVLTPLVVHYVFYTVLRVPLPWGVLEGIAW